jgi:hypothetical protein
MVGAERLPSLLEAQDHVRKFSFERLKTGLGSVVTREPADYTVEQTVGVESFDHKFHVWPREYSSAIGHYTLAAGDVPTTDSLLPGTKPHVTPAITNGRMFLMDASASSGV